MSLGKTRGVCDILIACVDGLKGFPDAIQSVFPDTIVQLCIVHQIRNSVKYVGSKHQKEFMRDLKHVYGAVNKESAETELLNLEEKWGEKYPIVIKSWQDNWERLTEYFQFTSDIRRMIYTTNTVEGYHRQIRTLWIASGKPFNPSTQAMSMSQTPRVCKSVNTFSQKFAPSFLEIYIPNRSLCPSLSRASTL